jgi:hypothetical protein
MAFDLAMLRKLAAQKASAGKPTPGKGKEAPAEPDADDTGKEAPGGKSTPPGLDPIAAAVARAKERLAGK